MEKKDESELNTQLKMLAKSSMVVFIGLFLSKVLAYFYRIIIARYYGPEVYGLFTLALIIVSFFITLSGLGFSEGLLRYIPIYRAKKQFVGIRTLINRVLKFYVVAGFLCSIFLWLFSEYIAVNIFHDSSLIPPIRLFTIIVLIVLFNNVLLASLRAFEEVSTYSLVFNIIQNIARFLSIVLIIFMGFRSGVNPVVWSFVLSMLATLMASFWFFKSKILPLLIGEQKKTEPADFSEFFSYSWPILFSSLIYLIFYWIDSLSLGYYKSAIEVGIYNAAVPIAMLLGIVPEILTQLFLPMINRYYGKKSYKIIEQLSKQVTKWIFITLLPMFILIFSFPGAALNILFGSQYLVAENALRILLIGSFISAMFAVSNNLISMIGKSKLILFNILIASICNFILNYILVPMDSILSLNNSNGMVGAALATLISIMLLNILFLIQTKRYLGFMPTRRNMISIGFLTIIPVFLLSSIKIIIPINLFSIILLCGFFILLYFWLIFIFKLLDKNDWMVIRAIIKKSKSLFPQEIISNEFG